MSTRTGKYRKYVKKYKRNAKKFYKKKRIPYANKLSSFPSSRICEMRFNQNYIMDSLADPNGTDENYLFANCLYRPDASDNTLRNALGYTEWGKFYERYVVLSAKIVVTFICPRVAETQTTNFVAPLMVGLQLTDGKELIPSITTLLENRGCVSRMMQQSASGNVVTLKSFYNAKKWHGIKDVMDVEELDCQFITSQEEADDPDAIAKRRLILHGGHYCRTLNIVTQRPMNIFKDIRSQINFFIVVKKCFKLVLL